MLRGDHARGRRHSPACSPPNVRPIYSLLFPFFPHACQADEGSGHETADLAGLSTLSYRLDQIDRTGSLTQHSHRRTESKRGKIEVQDRSRNNNMNGAEAMLRMLEAHGVRHIFGLCGDTSLPFYDALYRLDHDIEHILTRDERSAAYMADGYARISGPGRGLRGTVRRRGYLYPAGAGGSQ